MGKIICGEKEIVVPGDIIASGMDFIPGMGTFREGESVIASKLGMVNISGSLIKLIPLSGKYVPKLGDVIICKVIDVSLSGWRVDTNSAYSAMLSMKDASSRFISRGADLTRYFKVGEYMMTKIINVTSQRLVDITMKGPGLRKLSDGIVISVNPSKVPRIIGKNGSMVTMVKRATNCNIAVGQNGLVWIQGSPKDEVKAIAAIRKIENEAHISGLTERMEKELGYDSSKYENQPLEEQQPGEEGYHDDNYQPQEERQFERPMHSFHERREYSRPDSRGRFDTGRGERSDRGRRYSEHREESSSYTEKSEGNESRPGAEPEGSPKQEQNHNDSEKQ
jgi:exosome complex component RRP4